MLEVDRIELLSMECFVEVIRKYGKHFKSLFTVAVSMDDTGGDASLRTLQHNSC